VNAEEAATRRVEAAASEAPDVVARVLATELRRVPGIQRYADATLAELEGRGPRLARGLWGMARRRLDEHYGAMTVGELLRRFGERP
jgi:hypothetical protein